MPSARLCSTWREFDKRVASTLATLEVTPAARTVARDLLCGRLFPPVPGAGVMLRTLTGDLLPTPLRQAYDLPDTTTTRLATRAVRVGLGALWPLTPIRVQQFADFRVTRERLRA